MDSHYQNSQTTPAAFLRCSISRSTSQFPNESSPSRIDPSLSKPRDEENKALVFPSTIAPQLEMVKVRFGWDLGYASSHLSENETRVEGGDNQGPETLLLRVLVDSHQSCCLCGQLPFGNPSTTWPGYCPTIASCVFGHPTLVRLLLAI